MRKRERKGEIFFFLKEEEKENPPKRANPPHRASSQGLGGGAALGLAPLHLFRGSAAPRPHPPTRGEPRGVSENHGEGGGSEALQATGRRGNPVSTSLNGRKQAPQTALPGPGWGSRGKGRRERAARPRGG